MTLARIDDYRTNGQYEILVKPEEADYFQQYVKFLTKYEQLIFLLFLNLNLQLEVKQDSFP